MLRPGLSTVVLRPCSDATLQKLRVFLTARITDAFFHLSLQLFFSPPPFLSSMVIFAYFLSEFWWIHTPFLLIYLQLFTCSSPSIEYVFLCLFISFLHVSRLMWLPNHAHMFRTSLGMKNNKSRGKKPNFHVLNKEEVETGTSTGVLREGHNRVQEKKYF